MIIISRQRQRECSANIITKQHPCSHIITLWSCVIVQSHNELASQPGFSTATVCLCTHSELERKQRIYIYVHTHFHCAYYNQQRQQNTSPAAQTQSTVRLNEGNTIRTPTLFHVPQAPAILILQTAQWQAGPHHADFKRVAYMSSPRRGLSSLITERIHRLSLVLFKHLFCLNKYNSVTFYYLF